MNSKRLHLETKNIQTNENRSIGFIKSLHLHICSCEAVYTPIKTSKKSIRTAPGGFLEVNKCSMKLI